MFVIDLLDPGQIILVLNTTLLLLIIITIIVLMATFYSEANYNYQPQFDPIERTIKNHPRV